MEIKEALRSFFKEMILPEFTSMKAEQIKINERLNSVDKRLNDITAHLIDQSRRIDDINKRIDDINKRIDDTNKRIDSVRDELVGMIGETNKRIDRLYEVIVRRDEHAALAAEIQELKNRVHSLELRLAA